MAKQKPPPIPTQPSSSSSSSSSSSGEESPPPAISTVKNPPPFPKSLAKENEESTEEDSSEESDDPAAKSIPPTHSTDSRIQNVNMGLKSPSSDTESEDQEDEDGDEVNSSSDSEQQPPPPAKVEGNKSGTEVSRSDLVSEDESETSSDSDTITPPPPARVSSRNTADPSLKPLNSKPMDIPVHSAEKSPISKKRSVDSPAQISEKKRKTVDAVRSEGGQEKKEIVRRIWSKSDELVLLQCVLDCIEEHQGTSSPVQVEPLLKSQAESLLKSVNSSLSSSITIIQMSDKIRRLRMKYKNTAKKVKDGNNQIISNENEAAIFDLSRKIWDSSNKEPVFSENIVKKDKLKENSKEEKGKAKIGKLKENIKEEKGKTKTDKLKEDIKEEKVKAKTDKLKEDIKEEKEKAKKDKLKENIKEDKVKVNHLAVEYPFLNWHAMNDNINSALIVHSRIPSREAEELEGSCKKLEITEVQLHMKKMKLLSSSLKLIEDALAKL